MASTWGGEVSCQQSGQTCNVGADLLMLEMDFISWLLANHTHNPLEESKKTIQIMLLIQLRIEKTRKCPILYFLSDYQSDSQTGGEEEMRNECWIVGCQIKTRGLLRLCWVLYQIISKFSSYSAFQYCRCRERQVCPARLRMISFSWFLDHDLEIQIKSHFWSGCSWQFQRTIKYVYCWFH